MSTISFTSQVLAGLNEMAERNGGEVGATELSNHLRIKTFADHKKMLNALSELFRAGRIARVRQAVYAPATPERPPELRRVMWRILRMRRRVTVEDLQTMAGAGEAYVKEWLRMLERRDIVRKVDGDPTVWLLLSTAIDMPDDEQKAARLRELRAKRKKALADLRTAQTMIVRAIDALAREEEE